MPSAGLGRPKTTKYGLEDCVLSCGTAAVFFACGKEFFNECQAVD